MANPDNKPRPMHWCAFLSTETVCGKVAARCRTTRTLQYWDDLRMASGRRCETCATYVEQIRTKKEA